MNEQKKCMHVLLTQHNERLSELANTRELTEITKISFLLSPTEAWTEAETKQRIQCFQSRSSFLNSSLQWSNKYTMLNLRGFQVVNGIS